MGDLWFRVLVAVAVVLFAGAAAVGYALLVVGRQSEERGGVLDLDTPEARRALNALRRCNPDRRVHYHGDGDTCECGEMATVGEMLRAYRAEYPRVEPSGDVVDDELSRDLRDFLNGGNA